MIKIYGLLGAKLTHSFSAKYFNEKFEANGLNDHFYTNYELGTLNNVRDRDWSNVLGLNVTIPYKEEIRSHLDDIDDVAKAIGAVNTIRITDDQWVGYNTDVFGFELSIMGLLAGAEPERALILGSGGASKAIQYVLSERGISYTIVSRSGPFRYEDLNEDIIKTHPLIINTTPLGMYPNIDECPDIPYTFLTPSHYLFDLTYNPEKTLFLKRGEQLGASIQNGYEMLIFQAEKAWEIWNE